MAAHHQEDDISIRDARPHAGTATLASQPSCTFRQVFCVPWDVVPGLELRVGERDLEACH